MQQDGASALFKSYPTTVRTHRAHIIAHVAAISRGRSFPIKAMPPAKDYSKSEIFTRLSDIDFTVVGLPAGSQQF